MFLRWFYGLFTAAFLLSFYVWQQTQSIRMGYSVDTLRLECDKLIQENRSWRLQVNRLISMEKLDRVAQDRSLVIPLEKDVIYLP
ncbi:MAG: hypothetical protein A2293_06665 [Elusimicrobia bacterium RIFOXYB2_FULL_49_7]|nr:MAG: hypothetical protein A2293_06665 [Elusimicrobia bacterium RIFOXYB2_FULL_49_7]